MEIKSRIISGVSLSRFSTLKVGGRAKDFFIAETLSDIKEVYDMYDGAKIVLGGGSNVLVSDNGFNGLVILNRAKEIKFFFTKSGECVCKADSGVLLSRLSAHFLKLGFDGLSFGYHIPGTVGGAVKGNAGAFGGCMADIVESVTVLTSGGEVVDIKKDDCDFSYRKSNIPGIILSATIKVTLKDAALIKAEVVEFMRRRKESQPSGRSAGSVFKKVGDVAAGYYIDKALLKGERVGGAFVSNIHANFILNDGSATASDVKTLIDLVKARVRETFNVALEEEIIYIGEF